MSKPKTATDLAIAFANEYKQMTGHLPLIMHEEIYEFFGPDRVSIIEANVFDKIENAEVVISNSTLEVKQVTFSELTVPRQIFIDRSR